MDSIDTTVLYATTCLTGVETGNECFTNRLEQFKGANGGMGIF